MIVMIYHSVRFERYRWLALLVWLLSLSALAADAPPDAPVVTAPVTLDGITLFRVRGALSYPAAERADVIGERIAAFATDQSLSTKDLQIVETKDRTMIQIGNRPIATVVDADANPEGLTRQQVAELQLQKITLAVERYRHDRSIGSLVRAGVSALVATLLLVLLMFGMRRLSARLNASAKRHYQQRMEQLKAETRKIVQAERLQTALQGLFGFMSTLLQLTMVLVYLEFMLALWPWTRPLSERVLVIVLDPLRSMGAAVLAAIPGLVFVAILAMITRYVLKVARLYFSGIAAGSVTLANFDRDWAWPTYRILRLLTIAFAVVVAYPYIPGSDSSAFKGVSVLLGVIFSLGSTSVVANTVAGYTLVYRRAFKVGDRVRIGEHVGVIVEMRVQVTHLRSLKNEDVVIPNSIVLTSITVNYSALALQQGLILHTTVGIGYETPWRQVESMLIEAAQRTPGLLQAPSPFILQKSLGDFCVVYELNVYCDRPHESERLYTALHQNILDVFNEHNVQIMTPAYVGDPAEPKVVARKDWFLPPASPPPPKAKE
ncbi:MAG TPA: mechanosensitive ion channel protein MscS [Gammaproteobacteria bacterium]|nr:mechanosensitive ion channel protein MscS [Gammaproteobacteria bacterium]